MLEFLYLERHLGTQNGGGAVEVILRKEAGRDDEVGGQGPDAEAVHDLNPGHVQEQILHSVGDGGDSGEGVIVGCRSTDDTMARLLVLTGFKAVNVSNNDQILPGCDFYGKVL